MEPKEKEEQVQPPHCISFILLLFCLVVAALEICLAKGISPKAFAEYPLPMSPGLHTCAVPYYKIIEAK